MKILFLDIDGVLNYSELPITLNQDKIPDIKPDLATKVNEIIKATKAKIVMSSAWRNRFSPKEWKIFLAKHGLFADVISLIPRLPGHHRLDEIKLWLQSNKVDKFVIIDDINMKDLAPNSVETVYNIGITDNDVEKAIFILGKCE